MGTGRRKKIEIARPDRAFPARAGGVLLALWVFGMAPNAAAQTTTFNSDHATFLQEITVYLTEADKKQGRDFIEDVFAPAWNGGFYDAPRSEAAVRMVNFMVAKRFPAMPDVMEFCGALAAFATSGRPASEFDAWIAGLDKMAATGRKKNFADLVTVSKSLFKDNTLFASASTVWRSGSKAYTFRFDSVPSVVFSKVDLKCYAKGDSSVILATSGVYYPSSGLWQGKGGKLTWHRAGLDPQKTYAQWSGPYDLRLKSSDMEVDSALFHDPAFAQPLMGRVMDKVLANVEADKASFPRFESYDRRLRIPDIVPGIDYEGGFAMYGAKLQGYGTELEPAYLTFYRDKRPFIVTSGLYYSIDPERISSDDVRAVVHMAADSIYHPSVSLKFIKTSGQLSLIRKDEGLGKGPFYNSYHQLDMYFEALYWRVGDPTIEMGSLFGSSETRASFESYNYYRDKRYSAMMGMDRVHPLVRLNDYVKQVGNTFQAQDFSVFARLQKDAMIPSLIDLANKGYLLYDVAGEQITVLPRLKQHLLNSAGKLDYDALQLNSNAEGGKTATLDLADMDLALRGVSRIVLSDSQDVKIYPKDKEVVVKKGRDLSFSGVVQAGKLTFYGQDYYFHYTPFTIDLPNVDSVSFQADSFDPDEQGRTFLVRVKNVLESVSGSLELDDSGNKSGLKQENFPQYPKFNSTKESFVYYDKKTTQKGVYVRDKFYFRSDPFQIDSLDNFTNKGLNFPGTLVSGGIFPDIRETLGLQTDYALGFVRPTGEGGMPLYGNKARFTNDVILNSKGLQGNGQLDYLTTTLTSKDLIFCPDSTIGKADTLTNRKNTQANVPQVAAAGVRVRFEPGADKFYTSTQPRGKRMEMFDGQARLKGTTVLTPKGMTGMGVEDFGNATLASELFQFDAMKVRADTSDFRLTEGDTASIAFRTDNVKADIDLAKREGDFVSNGSETKVEFTVNQYICYMDRFKWYMDQGDVELSADSRAASASEDIALTGPNFISVRPGQDSLSFLAPKARYDLKRHIITASEVPYIPVADAWITPDSNRVRIRRNAEMDPLKNAVITANFITKHHRIYDASAEVKAKRDYTATGTLDYVDQDGKAWPIRLQNIRVDTSYQTTAHGTVVEKDAFQLSPYFDFYGDVSLQASNKFLQFSGSTRIAQTCQGLDKNWMPFTAEIDPVELYIPVGDTLSDALGDRIGNGVYLTNEDPFELYGTFLSRTRTRTDRPVVTATGLLYYDKAKREYIIGGKEKIKQRTLPGTLVSMNTSSCGIAGDGVLLVGVDLGRVGLTAVGTLDHLPATKETNAKAALIADFFFLDKALERMAEGILAFPDQQQTDLAKTPYEKLLREVLGLERSDKVISELNLKGEVRKMPDDMEKAIVFSDLKLVWDKTEQAWLSQGPIGLASVLKKPLFRNVKGKVEIARKRSGDSMTVFLQQDAKTWWFFQYSRNVLYAYSSDEQFNTLLTELKEEQTVQESGKGQADFKFMLTNKRKVDEFRDRHNL
jgi:hypothetical protein